MSALRVPHGSHASALYPLVPVFLTYVLSFVNIGIYWNNHHHLLFWLSRVPFFTGWMGQNHFATLPTAAYGVVLLMAGVAYYIKTVIITAQGPDSTLAEMLGDDTKGKISPVIYAVAIPIAFLNRRIAIALYVLVSLMWLVPDRRIESRL